MYCSNGVNTDTVYNPVKNWVTAAHPAQPAYPAHLPVTSRHKNIISRHATFEILWGKLIILANFWVISYYDVV